MINLAGIRTSTYLPQGTVAFLRTTCRAASTMGAGLCAGNARADDAQHDRSRAQPRRGSRIPNCTYREGHDFGKSAAETLSDADFAADATSFSQSVSFTHPNYT